MVLNNILTALNVKHLPSGFSVINTRRNFPLVATAVALLYTSYQITSSFIKRKQSQYKEVPMPTDGCYPVVGHLLSLGDEAQLEKNLSVWHKKLGPIVKLKLGVQTWIFVSDPHLAQKIFVANGVKVSGRRKTVFHQNYYSHGTGAIFTQPDTDWRKSRSVVLSVIAPQRIDQREEEIKEETLALVDRLLKDIDNGRGQMFPKSQVQLATFNLALTLTLGKRYDSYEDEEYQGLCSTLDRSFDFDDLFYDMPNLFPSLYYPLRHMCGKSEMKDWSDKFRAVLLPRVDEAFSKEGESMARALYKDGATREEALILTADFLGAASDTSLITILSIIKLMSIHTEVQSKAAAEIANFISLNGRLPKFGERDQLPYSICVIKECMRVRPTAPFGVPHTASEDVEVDGYFIPKGSCFISSMRSMHQNTLFYPDEPEKFKPERFMSNLKTMHAAANGKLDDRDQFNFGWGRRRCPGPYLAEMELFFIFTAILSKCAIEPASGGIPDMDSDKKAYFEVTFTRRS